MNVAILGNSQVATMVSDAIVKSYNPYLQMHGQSPLNIDAFITDNRGGLPLTQLY